MTNKPTLLYVEDDIEILNDITFLLKDYFSKIYTAADGEEALAMYSKHKPTIVLLDINIPKIDGLEVGRIIRKTDDSTPFIYLSAFSDREKLLKAIDIGVNSYLVKPLKILELKNIIDNILDNNLSTNVELGSGFTWDKQINKLLYKSKEVSLTKKEAQLIELLYNNKQKYFTSCEIASEIFDKNKEDEYCNNIVQLISRFKLKVSTKFKTEDFFIQNIYGVGYKMNENKS